MVAQVARAVRTAVAVAARVVVPMEAGAEEARAAVLTAAEEGEEAPAHPAQVAVPLAVAAAITKFNAPAEAHGLGGRLKVVPLCGGAKRRTQPIWGHHTKHQKSHAREFGLFA